MSGPSFTKIYHKTAYPSIDASRPELTAKGKTIVISGGGTGIGSETAYAFAKAGAHRIVILGRRQQPLFDTKARISSSFPSVEVVTIPTDATKLEDVTAAFKEVTSGGLKIDILISNAAVIGVQLPVDQISSDQLLAGILSNLNMNFNLTTVFLRHASPSATIIEINSGAAHLTFASGFASYSISKMATARFYSVLAYERPDLNIFCVQPGAIETDMAKEAGYKPHKEGEDWKFDAEKAGNLSAPDDATLPAGFCVWLASPEGRFLKGKYLWANWDVDEMKERREEIVNSNVLELGLNGWPF